MILFLAPLYYADDKRLPVLPVSLMEQRDPDWRLILHTDGPAAPRIKDFIRSHRDDRIIYEEGTIRRKNFGHPIRNDLLMRLRDKKYMPEVDKVVITNPDNYYMPAFCDMVSTGMNVPRCQVGFCENIIHNYIAWDIMPTKLHCGHIDIGGCILRREIAAEIAWPWNDHSSDWTLLDQIIRKYGPESFVKIKGCLFVHN